MIKIVQTDQKVKVLREYDSHKDPVVILDKNSDPHQQSMASLLALKSDLIAQQKGINSVLKKTDVILPNLTLTSKSTNNRFTIYYNFFKNNSIECFFCHSQLNPEEVTTDHYIPSSRGGEDHIENLKVSCVKCNTLKKNFHPHNEKKVYKKFLQLTKRDDYLDMSFVEARDCFIQSVIEDENISSKELIYFHAHYLNSAPIKYKIEVLSGIVFDDEKRVLEIIKKHLFLKERVREILRIEKQEHLKERINDDYLRLKSFIVENLC